ncbi:MAG: hypothetical protein KDH20_15985 [Rhodocyclaceae bacterium]|nr:hypothetical protein [Rhodocyclaceae bacterium]
MKTQISRDSHRPDRHYSSVRLQQGRMIVDADWNELADIGRQRLDDALDDAVRSGAPRDAGVRLFLSGSGLRLSPGRLYADGVPAVLDGTASGVLLTAQPDYPNAPPLPGGDLRIYADVWERSVSALEDPELMDPGLHGADTASRGRTMLQVKWADPAFDPLDPAVNPPLGTARLSLSLRTLATSDDPCDPCAAQVAVDERVGNYLFRVEVHALALSGGDTLLTLKWSRDNGAEAYATGATPAGFGQGDWVWEYFDAASEMQLGLHPSAGFQPRRGILSESFTLPASATDPQAFVRQWDGYATINLTTATLVAGRDRGVALSNGLADGAHGRIDLAAGSFTAQLELMVLTLDTAGATLLPGDHWLAAVREAVMAGGDVLLSDALPDGVRHHFVELGQRIGGALVPPPGLGDDAFSRQMHFPPLTDLHAADVGFTEPPGCAGLYAGAANVQDALARICQIGAEDVGVTLPEPLPPNTVASLLAAQLGAGWPDLDGQPRTPSVQDMLQALLLQANGAALPYTVPPCGDATTPSVRSLLGVAAGPGQVGTVLDALLCQLTGAQLPLDPGSLTCPELIGSGETTVQGGLDFLCRTRLSSCAVTVPVGALEGLLQDFAANTQQDLWLCLMPGLHTISAAITIAGKRSLRISAAAAGASTVRLVSGVMTLEASELGLEGIGVSCTSSTRLVLRGNRIVANRCLFTRSSSNANLAPMVRLEALASNANLIWRDNAMRDTWHRDAGSGGVFDPGLVANPGVIAAIDNIRATPTLVEDDVLYGQLAGELANAIGAMSGNERLAWRNAVRDAPSVTPGGPVMALRAPLVTDALLGGGRPILDNATFGVRTDNEIRADFTSAIDGINAVGGDSAASAADVDILIALLFESGYNVALNLASNQLSGNLTDNHIDAELMLMNGLDTGLDPQTVTIGDRNGTATTAPVSGSGHLGLTGNRIQRLWARLPNGSVANSSLGQTVPGYASLTLSGNQLVGYGHSACAEVLTVTGNRLIDTATTGSQTIGRLFCNRGALTANVSAAGNSAAVLAVIAPAATFPGNLVTINRI